MQRDSWWAIFSGVHPEYRYLFLVVGCHKSHAVQHLLCHVACASAGFGKLLKKVIRQVRPLSTCEALGVCNKPGMPSSHSQVILFLVALEVFQIIRKWYSFRQERWQQFEQLCTVFFCTSASVLVAFSRVYLGYHDIPQVLAGAAAGISCAAMCFTVTCCAAKQFPVWQRSTIGRLLRLKDTWWINDNLLFEYNNTVSNSSKKSM